jgi:hypothetical protein
MKPGTGLRDFLCDTWRDQPFGSFGRRQSGLEG